MTKRKIISKEIDLENVSVIPKLSFFRQNITQHNQRIKAGIYPEMSHIVRIYVFFEGKKTP